MPKLNSPTSAIEKVCQVFCCLADPRVRRLKDVADTTGIDKASVLRVLHGLIASGLVQRDEDSKEYKYGDQAYLIASTLPPRVDLRTLAQPSLLRLAKVTGDSVHLLVRQGLESVCIAREIGDWPIRAGTIDVGSRRPLAMGSGSMALLAWLESTEIDFVLSEIAPQLSARSAVTTDMLRAEILASRERGYTRLLDLIVPSIGAVGVPLLDGSGAVVGAISISSVTARIAERESFLADVLRKEASSIRAAFPQQSAHQEMSKFAQPVKS